MEIYDEQEIESHRQPFQMSLTVLTWSRSPVDTPSAHINNKRQSSGSGSLFDVTPHSFSSSSIGVLGCKINTNRVAYWPDEVDCDNLCIKLTNVTAGRSVTLLRIDHSGGAHDISYDAWNYLATGHPAAPGTAIAGGAMGEIHYQYLPADNCKSLITDGSGKLPLMGANSMNFLSLYHKGYDEKCTLAAGANQATCPHALGSGAAVSITNPTDHKVMNIEYPTGKEVPA
ncbi:hypothetical protein B0T13DRAFT_486758 [Neurospora crassa]|nr:hypothetical protein B0T13DRAFT_486758 [Neurospora crassa]